jgi:hypothetical protein
MLSIEDFIALVRKEGFQRPNRFHVEISIPEKVKEKLQNLVNEIAQSPGAEGSGGATKSAADVERVISLMATDVSSPGFIVSASDMKIGHSRKIANDKSNGDLNITFRCGGNMTERKLFDSWRKFMFKSNHTVAFYDDYIAPTIKIKMLDMEGNITYEAAVTEAYPATVTELGLSRDQNDSIMTFQVTFNFRKLYNNDEGFGEKIRSFPPVFGRSVQTPPPDLEITASGLPMAPTSGNEFPPMALPLAPPTNNEELFLLDVYKSIERVKRRIEDGSLNTSVGAKMIISITRDVNASWRGNESTNRLLNYANDLVYVLERF